MHGHLNVKIHKTVRKISKNCKEQAINQGKRKGRYFLPIPSKFFLKTFWENVKSEFIGS